MLIYHTLVGILINTSSRDGEREKNKINLTFQLEVEAEPSDEEPELKQLEEQADIDGALVSLLPCQLVDLLAYCSFYFVKPDYGIYSSL